MTGKSLNPHWSFAKWTFWTFCSISLKIVIKRRASLAKTHLIEDWCLVSNSWTFWHDRSEIRRCTSASFLSGGRHPRGVSLGHSWRVGRTQNCWSDVQSCRRFCWLRLLAMQKRDIIQSFSLKTHIINPSHRSEDRFLLILVFRKRSNARMIIWQGSGSFETDATFAADDSTNWEEMNQLLDVIIRRSLPQLSWAAFSFFVPSISTASGRQSIVADSPHDLPACIASSILRSARVGFRASSRGPTHTRRAWIIIHVSDAVPMHRFTLLSSSLSFHLRLHYLWNSYRHLCGSLTGEYSSNGRVMCSVSATFCRLSRSLSESTSLLVGDVSRTNFHLSSPCLCQRFASNCRPTKKLRYARNNGQLRKCLTSWRMDLTQSNVTVFWVSQFSLDLFSTRHRRAGEVENEIVGRAEDAGIAREGRRLLGTREMSIDWCIENSDVYADGDMHRISTWLHKGLFHFCQDNAISEKILEKRARQSKCRIPTRESHLRSSSVFWTVLIRQGVTK
jgi:hypothetical protein